MTTHQTRITWTSLILRILSLLAFLTIFIFVIYASATFHTHLIIAYIVIPVLCLYEIILLYRIHGIIETSTLPSSKERIFIIVLDALVIGVCVASPLGVAITLRAKHFENDERESECWVWGNRVVAGAWGVGLFHVVIEILSFVQCCVGREKKAAQDSEGKFVRLDD